MTSLPSETFSLEKKRLKAVITELVLWSLNYCVFSELNLLKQIEANGYDYLKKIIPIPSRSAIVCQTESSA